MGYLNSSLDEKEIKKKNGYHLASDLRAKGNLILLESELNYTFPC